MYSIPTPSAHVTISVLNTLLDCDNTIRPTRIFDLKKRHRLLPELIIVVIDAITSAEGLTSCKTFV